MNAKCSADAVGKHIAQLRVAALFEDCWTCYWLQRFLWQLELDAEPEAGRVIQPLKVPRNQLHGHCSCRPCAPSESFAQYLQETRPRPAGTARRLTRCSKESHAQNL